MAVNLSLNIKKAGDGSPAASGRAHLKDFALVPGEGLGKKVERDEPLFLNPSVPKHFVRDGRMYVYKKGSDKVLNADMSGFFGEILGCGDITVAPNKEHGIAGQRDKRLVWVPGTKEMMGVGTGHYYFFTSGVLGIFINEKEETARAYWAGTPAEEKPFHTFRDVYIADEMMNPHRGTLYAASPNAILVISKGAAYSYHIETGSKPFFNDPSFHAKTGGSVEVHDHFDSMSRHVFNIHGQGNEVEAVQANH